MPIPSPAIAIAAAAAAAAAAGVTLALLIRFFLLRFQHSSPNCKDSETASSDPSAAAGDAKRGGAGASPRRAAARRFGMEELEQATMEFNESSIIGCGAFGLVFKGLLSDGTVVAIKRRDGGPRPEFADEVDYLSTIQHRNLVTLLGYCQERGSQMLVFEYLPNSSISNHLYGRDSTTKLEFKQRLSIAIGAAKGLCHLHGLQPPSIHCNFKTSNVLVDENFIAKVADVGILRLLEKIEDAGSSSCSNSFNAFRDPKFGVPDPFQDRSDVYSFGVFLIELVSGKEADYKKAFQSNDDMYQWVHDRLSSDHLIDQRLIGSFTEEGMKDLIKLMVKCMMFPRRERPRMESVVMELDSILENEITRTTIMEECTAIVTLGSQLFTN